MYVKTSAIVNNQCFLYGGCISKPYLCTISFYSHTRQIILTRGYAHLYFTEEKTCDKEGLIIYLRLQNEYELKMGSEHRAFALNHEAIMTLEFSVTTSLLLEIEFKACLFMLSESNNWCLSSKLLFCMIFENFPSAVVVPW